MCFMVEHRYQEEPRQILAPRLVNWNVQSTTSDYCVDDSTSEPHSTEFLAYRSIMQGTIIGLGGNPTIARSHGAQGFVPRYDDPQN
jgi:hypothetical protein